MCRADNNSTASTNTTVSPDRISANVPLPGLITGGVCALIAILSSVWLIYKHLRNYTEPRFQKPIIRILVMVPVYAINSWLGLYFWKYSIYLDIPRDCYEAYALYQFFRLLIAYLGGERSFIPILEDKPPVQYPIPCCCLTFKPGYTFYALARLCILQFVLIKPLISITSLLLAIPPVNKYCDGEFTNIGGGYMWLTIIDNLSITITLWYLILFYMSVKEELAQYNPIPKFLAIKTVVFFTFWQGILISLLAAVHVIHDSPTFKTNNISAALQDWLICVEMCLIGLWHHWVFPFAGFRDPTKTPFLKDIRRNAKPLLRNFGDVISQSDMIDETASTFHPDEIKHIIKTGKHAFVAPRSRPLSAEGERGDSGSNSSGSSKSGSSVFSANRSHYSTFAGRTLEEGDAARLLANAAPEPLGMNLDQVVSSNNNISPSPSNQVSVSSYTSLSAASSPPSTPQLKK